MDRRSCLWQLLLDVHLVVVVVVLVVECASLLLLLLWIVDCAWCPQGGRE